MEKFGKFNKYAAARKAQKEGGWKSKDRQAYRRGEVIAGCLTPKFGKALSKSAVAQRIAANPKSAALRKTSKNNPINKLNVPPTGKTGITKAMSKKVILVTGDSGPARADTHRGSPYRCRPTRFT